MHPLMRRNHPAPPASSETARPGSTMFPVEGSGDLSAAWEGSALVLRNFRPAPIWGQITGQATGTNRYSFTQLDDGDVDGTFGLNLSSGFSATGTSAADGFPAYELHGRTGVPVGAKVQLWIGGDGSFWVFSYTGLAGEIPAFDNVVVTEGTLNGEPATFFTIYAEDPYDATTPAMQYVIANDADGLGNPGVIQYIYPNGTGSDPSFTQLVTELEVTTTYIVGGTELTQSVTEPSAGVVEIHTGNAAGTQGTTAQYTVDGDGDIDQVTVTTKVDGATDPVTHQFTLDAGDTLETITGAVDLSGATVTSSGATWTKVITITHADLTDADTSQDVLAYTLPAKTALMGGSVRTKTAGSGGGVSDLSIDLILDAAVSGGATCNGLIANSLGGFAGAGFTRAHYVTSWTATKDLYARFDSVGGNVADLTAGEWEVRLFLATLPD